MSLNLNSITVQNMLNNTPQGFGNIPAHFGSSPTIETETVQATAQPSFQSPYPSPRDMLIQQAQQPVYQPVGFGGQPMAPTVPRNIVGAYNPGFNQAFGNYYNPYMGYGSYGGYTPQMQNFYPMDDDARYFYEGAMLNGISYKEQVDNEAAINKMASRIVSKNLGRTEEEATACEAAFNPYFKDRDENGNFRDPYMLYRRKETKGLHVQIVVGEEVVADCAPNPTVTMDYYTRNTGIVESMKSQQAYKEISMTNYRNQLYARAPERQFDNTPLLELFNDGIGVILADKQRKDLIAQNTRLLTQVYNRDSFKERLLRNNGIRPKGEMKAVERFVGRYGMMPDGRPVSPQHDPSIAESFAINPQTGQIEITAPNFIRNRMEAARDAFMRTIDKG